MSKGSYLIAAERERQAIEEGYTFEHDAGHASELTEAAISYALAVIRRDGHHGGRWPWHPRYWKPTGDPVRDLVKAGALIAAAIDSLAADDGSQYEMPEMTIAEMRSRAHSLRTLLARTSETADHADRALRENIAVSADALTRLADVIEHADKWADRPPTSPYALGLRDAWRTILRRARGGLR